MFSNAASPCATQTCTLSSRSRLPCMRRPGTFLLFTPTQSGKSSCTASMTCVLCCRVVQAVCGGTHTIALTEEGRIFIWGRGSFGAWPVGSRMQVAASSMRCLLPACPMCIYFQGLFKSYACPHQRLSETLRQMLTWCCCCDYRPPGHRHRAGPLLANRPQPARCTALLRCPAESSLCLYSSGVVIHAAAVLRQCGMLSEQRGSKHPRWIMTCQAATGCHRLSPVDHYQKQ